MSKPTVVSLVGDSITYGYISPEHSPSVVLQERLGNSYIVHNFGVSGTTAHKSSVSYTDTPEYANALDSNWDILIITLGTNDNGYLSLFEDDNEKGVKIFERDYTALVQSFIDKKKDSRIILGLPPVINPMFVKGITNGVHPVIKRVANSLNLEICDLFTPTNERISEYLWYDKLHPTIEGMKMIGDAFFETISKKKPSMKTVIDLTGIDPHTRPTSPSPEPGNTDSKKHKPEDEDNKTTSSLFMNEAKEGNGSSSNTSNNKNSRSSNSDSSSKSDGDNSNAGASKSDGIGNERQNRQEENAHDLTNGNSSDDSKTSNSNKHGKSSLCVSVSEDSVSNTKTNESNVTE